ncbi:MAG: FmdB family zinc ribbon protein, partial [Promethearchaeota archaeon]
MPLYSYECVFCHHKFDEINEYERSGKTYCPKCANKAFKIPAIFSTKIFKQRVFADGTKTPDFIGDHKQEKAWLKSQGITYDPPSQHQRYNNKRKRKKE